VSISDRIHRYRPEEPPRKVMTAAEKQRLALRLEAHEVMRQRGIEPALVSREEIEAVMAELAARQNA
jgi:hypothetical protein